MAFEELEGIPRGNNTVNVYGPADKALTAAESILMASTDSRIKSKVGVPGMRYKPSVIAHQPQQPLPLEPWVLGHVNFLYNPTVNTNVRFGYSKRGVKYALTFSSGPLISIPAKVTDSNILVLHVTTVHNTYSGTPEIGSLAGTGWDLLGVQANANNTYSVHITDTTNTYHTLSTTKTFTVGDTVSIVARYIPGVSIEAWVNGEYFSMATAVTTLKYPLSHLVTYLNSLSSYSISASRLDAKLPVQALRSISENPWSVFRPPEKKLFVGNNTKPTIQLYRKIVSNSLPRTPAPPANGTDHLYNFTVSGIGSRGMKTTLNNGALTSDGLYNNGTAYGAYLGPNPTTAFDPRTGDFTVLCVFNLAASPGNAISAYIAASDAGFNATNYWGIAAKGDAANKVAIRSAVVNSSAYIHPIGVDITVVYQRINGVGAMHIRSSAGYEVFTFADTTDYYNRLSSPFTLMGPSNTGGSYVSASGILKVFCMSFGKQYDARSLAENPYQVFASKVGCLENRPYVKPQPLLLPKYQDIIVQPQQMPVIDWMNPLTKDLVIAVVPGIDANIVTQSPFFTAPNVTRRAVGAGLLGKTYITGSGTYSHLSLPANSSAPSAIYDYHDEATISILARQISSANSDTYFCRGNGSGTPTWSIGLHSGTYNGPFVQLGTYNYSPTSTVHNTKLPRLISATSSTSMGTAATYVDGTQVHSGTFATSTPQYDTTAARGVIVGSSGAGHNVSGECYLMLKWHRVLSAKELTSLSDNPWQIFKANNIRARLK